MRSDIIKKFCEGKKPKDLIAEKVATSKTIYYYHAIYNDMKEALTSEEVINALIMVLLNLRIKEQ